MFISYVIYMNYIHIFYICRWVLCLRLRILWT